MQTNEPNPIILFIIFAVFITLMIFIIASIWKTFEKAGEPGWAAIIPIYNIYIMVKIAGKEGWWTLLFFIPIVSLVISIIISIEIAKKFGKDTGFGLGLAFLGIIFWPILGFGDAVYNDNKQIDADLKELGTN